mmetsp:Transcript_11799/g.47605  ORF Transcript_11799/g.47605 Transcript_11799/m.47605 type:complete len:254 (+) Transcript_11799:304-1065(+)
MLRGVLRVVGGGPPRVGGERDELAVADVAVRCRGPGQVGVPLREPGGGDQGGPWTTPRALDVDAHRAQRARRLAAQPRHDALVVVQMRALEVRDDVALLERREADGAHGSRRRDVFVVGNLRLVVVINIILGRRRPGSRVARRRSSWLSAAAASSEVGRREGARLDDGLEGEAARTAAPRRSEVVVSSGAVGILVVVVVVSRAIPLRLGPPRLVLGAAAPEAAEPVREAAAAAEAEQDDEHGVPRRDERPRKP